MLASTLLALSIHKLVLSSPIPTREIADSIGMPYPTLMRQANPNDRGSKMSIETLVDLMRVTGDYTPLEEIAKILGFHIVR